MKLRLLSLASALGLAFVGTLSAGPIVLIQEFTPAMYFSTAGLTSYTGTFNLAASPSGYDPVVQQVDSAIASFSFSDVRGSNPETVQVNLGERRLLRVSQQLSERGDRGQRGRVPAAEPQ